MHSSGPRPTVSGAGHKDRDLPARARGSEVKWRDRNHCDSLHVAFVAMCDTLRPVNAFSVETAVEFHPLAAIGAGGESSLRFFYAEALCCLTSRVVNPFT